MIQDNVQKDLPYSPEYIKGACNAMYTRVKSLYSYESKVPKLKSKIKVVKPTEPFFKLDNYGVQAFTEHPVESVTVPGDHVTCLKSLECAQKINSLILNVNK